MEKIHRNRSEPFIESARHLDEGLQNGRTRSSKILAYIPPKIKNAVSDSMDRLASFAGETKQFTFSKSKDISRGIDKQARENPWAAIGIATIVGMMIGYKLSKKK